MDKKDYIELFRAYGLWDFVVDTSDDGGEGLELTDTGHEFIDELIKLLKEEE
jgi:hypothetical protein